MYIALWGVIYLQSGEGHICKRLCIYIYTVVYAEVKHDRGYLCIIKRDLLNLPAPHRTPGGKMQGYTYVTCPAGSALKRHRVCKSIISFVVIMHECSPSE